MGDNPMVGKAGFNEAHEASGTTWSDISSSLFSYPHEAIKQSLQGIKDGATAVNYAATAAGAAVEGAVEGGLRVGAAGATAVVGTAVDVVAGKAAGAGVRAGAAVGSGVVIDKVGDAVDSVTQAVMGGPQSKIAKAAAEAALGAMSVGASGAAGKAAGKMGGAAIKGALPLFNRDAMLDPVIPAEKSLPDAVQKAGQRFADELMQTPSDVYNHVRNNPWRAVPVGLFGGLGGLVIDSKLAKAAGDK